jgi:membrane protein implicated in regulation of membrane protease activity
VATPGKLMIIMGANVALTFGLLLAVSWRFALLFVTASAGVGFLFYAVFVWLPEWKEQRDARKFMRDIEARRKGEA